MYNMRRRYKFLSQLLNRENKFQPEAEDCSPDHARQKAALGEEDQGQARHEDDPRHQPGQRLLADVERDGEHQPDRGGGEAADETLYRALMAHALIAFE